MKKILLIEDVASRQEDFMSHTDFTLKSYDDILENMTNDKYKSISTSLKDDTFNFDDYNMVISHKTAFEEQTSVIVNKLESYCESTKKPLVFFSGGITNYYKNTIYEYLELNSKDFYGQNLKVFLDNYRKNKQNILMLSYGDKWVLNVLLNILEKINLFLNKNDETDIVYDEFRNFTHINRLESISYEFYQMDVDDGWIYREEIQKIKDSITKYVKDATNV